MQTMLKNAIVTKYTTQQVMSRGMVRTGVMMLPARKGRLTAPELRAKIANTEVFAPGSFVALQEDFKASFPQAILVVQSGVGIDAGRPCR